MIALSFAPSLVNIQNAASYFLVDKVVNRSFS